MMVSPLPPYFLDTYSLSMSSLRCKALCMVINFLVVWSICLSLVHFKNNPEYLTRRTALVFILLIRYYYYLFYLFVMPPFNIFSYQKK